MYAVLIYLLALIGPFEGSSETYYYFLTATNDEIRTPEATRIVYLTSVRTTDTYISASFLRNAQEDFAARINGYSRHRKPQKQWFNTEIRTGADEEQLQAERDAIVKKAKTDNRTRLVEFKE